MGLSHGVSRWLLEKEVRQILWMPWGLPPGGLTLIGRFQVLILSSKQQREAPRDKPMASAHWVLRAEPLATSVSLDGTSPWHRMQYGVA